MGLQLQGYLFPVVWRIEGVEHGSQMHQLSATQTTNMVSTLRRLHLMIGVVHLVCKSECRPEARRRTMGSGCELFPPVVRLLRKEAAAAPVDR